MSFLYTCNVMAQIALVLREEGNFSPTLEAMYSKYNKLYDSEYIAPSKFPKLPKMLAEIRNILFDEMESPSVLVGYRYYLYQNNNGEQLALDEVYRYVAKKSNPAIGLYFPRIEDELMLEWYFEYYYGRAKTYHRTTRKRVRIAKKLMLISHNMVTRHRLPNGTGNIG
jgi:hypothetical protein